MNDRNMNFKLNINSKIYIILLKMYKLYAKYNNS